MKILHVIIGVVLSLVILAVSWFLIGSCWQAHPVGDFLLGTFWGKWMLGGVLVCLLVLFWLTAMPVGATEHFLSFEMEGGAVSISVRAINDFLSKLGQEFSGVQDLRAHIAALRDGALEVRLEIHVKAGVKIQQVSQALQQRVRESLRDGLGITDVAAVKVSVLGIVPADETPAEQSAPRTDW